MLQINPFLDCTVYSGIVVHIARNNQITKRWLVKAEGRKPEGGRDLLSFAFLPLC